MWAVFIGVLAAPVASSAQGPKSISYQGFLTDAAGNPIDGAERMVIKLFPSPAGGMADWTRDYGLVIISNGLFHQNLDAGSPNFGALSDIVMRQQEEIEKWKIENGNAVAPTKSHLDDHAYVCP